MLTILITAIDENPKGPGKWVSKRSDIAIAIVQHVGYTGATERMPSGRWKERLGEYRRHDERRVCMAWDIG